MIRSKATLAAIWVISTLVAVTVVWQSLSFVSTRTDSPESVALPVAGPETTAVGGVVGSIGSQTDPSSPADPGGGTGLPGGGPVGTGSEGTGSEGTVPSTTTTAPTTTRTTAKPSTTQAGTIDQTFPVTGGTAAVRFSPSAVTVLWATPSDGYTVKVEPNENGRLRIEFRRGDSRTRLEVWWDNGPRSATSRGGSGGGND